MFEAYFGINRVKSFVFGRVSRTVVFSLLLLLPPALLLGFRTHRADSWQQSLPSPEAQLATSVHFSAPDGALLQERYMVVARLVSGATLRSLLRDYGLSEGDIQGVTEALSKHIPLRSLNPGKRIKILLSGYGDQRTWYRARMNVDDIHYVVVTKDASGKILIEKHTIPTEENHVVNKGFVGTSLLASMQEENIPNAVAVKFANLFSYEVDFKRDVRPGDTFVIYYADYLDAKTKKPTGKYILYYGALVVQGKRFSIYRFKRPHGASAYYDPQGRSVKAFLNRYPVAKVRITSPFGERIHPILGYRIMHTGVDLANKEGTPIRATGRGVIVRKGWAGSYGRMVAIRHVKGYVTRYAHMLRFAKNIKKGSFIKRGQIIGYMGHTGRTTGPHVHYEVLRYHRFYNPSKFHLPKVGRLVGVAYRNFRKARDAIDHYVMS